MSSAAQLTQAHIFTSLLSSVSPSSPLSDSLLHSLALSVSPTALLDALDLIDRDSVSRLAPPSGRAIYQVQSQSGGGGGGASYTVVVGGGCAAPSAPTRSAFFEKKVTLDYLAGLATKFGAANPPQAGARQAGQAGQAGGAG
ncbi:hypothetical protein JCM8547_005633 [Rhodosporidiobolus lusitaniae]